MYILLYVMIIALILCCCNQMTFVESKVYMRCELSRELLERHQISKTFLSNWICLIEHESNRDTSKVTNLPNGGKKYGLFQINSKDCNNGNNVMVESCDLKIYPCCRMSCNDFLNDNITDDVECAKQIFKLRGFQYWNGWTNYCRDKQNLPNLNVACNILSPLLSRFLRILQFDD